MGGEEGGRRVASFPGSPAREPGKEAKRRGEGRRREDGEGGRGGSIKEKGKSLVHKRFTLGCEF